MPKIVDHDARRVEIARAVLAVVARDGAGAATVRAVAGEAGCSTGVLAHYFRTKDELLSFAVTELRAGFVRRLRALPEATGDAAGPRAWLASVLRELLPLDEERYRELLAWCAFLTLARQRPELTASIRSGNQELEVLVVDALRAAGVGGDVGAAALELLCFVDGLALRHVFDTERLGSTELVRHLDARLDELLRPRR